MKKTFKCVVVFVTPATNQKKASEMHLSQLYLVQNVKEAIEAAEKWAQNRLNTLFTEEDLGIDLHGKKQHTEIFSVEVMHYFIQEPDVDGYIGSKNGFPFFKWREDHDYGMTLQQKIEKEVELYSLL